MRDLLTKYISGTTRNYRAYVTQKLGAPIVARALALVTKEGKSAEALTQEGIFGRGLRHPPTMRGITVRAINMVAGMIILCIAIPSLTIGQVHEKYEGWCDGLQNATLPALVQFLNGVVPDQTDGRCITWVIHKLGKEQHEPAIPALVKFLDFRVPRSPGEEIFHQDLSVESFPAEEALESIGENALPDVLRAIESDSTLPLARENAVSVWMGIYRQSDEQPKAISLLKQEEIKVNDGAIKKRLGWAVQKALTYCNPPEKAACQQAADT
jgi:hypothetical protein